MLYNSKNSSYSYSGQGWTVAIYVGVEFVNRAVLSVTNLIPSYLAPFEVNYYYSVRTFIELKGVGGIVRVDLTSCS